MQNGLLLKGRASVNNLRERGKITLAMRVIASIWFALVFGVLALVNFSYFGGHFEGFRNTVLSIGGFYFIIAPTSVAGLCGWFFGGRILVGSNRSRAVIAALRGTAIGLLCLAFYIGAMALHGTLSSARREFMQFVSLMIYLGVFWGLDAVIPVAMVGALAGLLLYWTKFALRKVT